MKSKPKSYKEVVKDPKSKTELICAKSHSFDINISFNQIATVNYNKGDVLPRNMIHLKPKKWLLNSLVKKD